MQWKSGFQEAQLRLPLWQSSGIATQYYWPWELLDQNPACYLLITRTPHGTWAPTDPFSWAAMPMTGLTIQCCVWGLENARLLKYTVCVLEVKLSSVQIWNWTRLAFGRRPFLAMGPKKMRLILANAAQVWARNWAVTCSLNLLSVDNGWLRSIRSWKTEWISNEKHHHQ